MRRRWPRSGAGHAVPITPAGPAPAGALGTRNGRQRLASARANWLTASRRIAGLHPPLQRGSTYRERRALLRRRDEHAAPIRCPPQRRGRAWLNLVRRTPLSPRDSPRGSRGQPRRRFPRFRHPRPSAMHRNRLQIPMPPTARYGVASCPPNRVPSVRFSPLMSRTVSSVHNSLRQSLRSARRATKQSHGLAATSSTGLLRGACPRAARSADPGARNDSVELCIELLVHCVSV
jgi:hypothetical protein